MTLIMTSALQAHMDSSQTRLMCSVLRPVGRHLPEHTFEEFIPGSSVLGIKDFSEPLSSHTLLNTQDFEAKCMSLGLLHTSPIVLYDQLGIYSSPRAWFQLKYMGCEQVHVLQGGLPAWKRAHGTTTAQLRDSPTPVQPFCATPRPSMIASKEDVWRGIDDSEVRIVDLRSADRFWGRCPEPRAHLRTGHIPSSINLPYSSLLHKKKYKPTPELAQIFTSLGLHRAHTLNLYVRFGSDCMYWVPRRSPLWV
jgi:thiosulfate/3-mercaptopyruvate sulfurtransferase